MSFLQNLLAIIRGQILIFPRLNIGLVRVFGPVSIRGPKLNLIIGNRAVFWGNTTLVMSSKFNDYIEIGDNVIVETGCYFLAHSGKIIIGNNSFICVGAIIQGKGGVNIGEDVLIGPGVKIFSSDHVVELNDIPRRSLGESEGPVHIQNNVWIGASSIILKGSVLPAGSVIAAGTVVRKPLGETGLYASPIKLAKIRRL